MSKEMSFAIFCIENYKVYRALTGKQTVELFLQYGVLDYLVEFYDILHSTGHHYVNQDIDDYLHARNAVLPSA